MGSSESVRQGAARADASPCFACSGPRGDGTRCEHCGVALEVGGYRPERLLAAGPHSRVYVARGPSGARVALKELLFAQIPDADELDAFEREARVLSGLSHAQLPKMIGAFQDGAGVHRRFYLAQEFAEGVSLADRLSDGPLSEAEVLTIAGSVLDVLSYLHGQVPSIVHRDLKPANLILRPGGDTMLVDFGSARELPGKGTHRSTLTGTFGYMAPEQLGGTVDPRSDLYGLGATLFHALSGKAPGDALSYFGRKLQLDKYLPRASPDARAFLQRLMAADPDERYPSAAAARAALDALRVRPGTVFPGRRGLRRLWLGLALVAVGASVGVALHAGRPGPPPGPSEVSRDGMARSAQQRPQAGPPQGLPVPPGLGLQIEMHPDWVQELDNAGKHSLARELESAISSAGFVGRKGRVVVGKLDFSDGSSFLPSVPGTAALGNLVRTLSEGYFAAPVGAGQKGLELLVDGYEPIFLDVRSLPGWISEIAPVHLKRLAPERLATVSGNITAEGGGRVQIELYAQSRYANISTVLSGTGSASATSVRLSRNGSLLAEGLSPGVHVLNFVSPGHAMEERPVELAEGRRVDLGAVVLKRVSFRYSISESRDFSASPVLSEDSPIGGWRQQTGPNIYFKQERLGNGEVVVKMYAREGPAELLDLGTGTLGAFMSRTDLKGVLRPLGSLRVEHGHVYLLYTAPRHQWMLFEPSVEQGD